MKLPPLKGKLIFLCIASFFVVLHFALEPFVEKYLNKKLSELDIYTGSIDDVDIHLYRGAYGIDGLEIKKRGSEGIPPLFRVERVDLSVLWSALFKGQVVAAFEFTSPELVMVDGTSNETSQSGTTTDWRAVVKSLTPIMISRIGIVDGVAKLQATGKPPAAISITGIDGEVRGLSNSGEGAATGKFDAIVQESGKTDISFSLDPFAEAATFDVNLQLDGLELTAVEKFTRHYANVDFEKGTLALAIEVAAKSGALDGYIKPVFTDVEVYDVQEDVVEDNDNPLRQVWEGIVGVFAEPVENQSEEQLATRIPIGGSVDDFKTNLFAAIGALIKNAFGDPLTATLENSVGD